MEIANLFDLFGNEETVNEVKTEVKAKSEKKEPVKETKVEDVNEAGEASTKESSENDAILDSEDDDISDEMTTGDDEDSADEKKSPAPKKSAGSKKSKVIKVKGPVKVVGCGWIYEYGEEGKEYTPLACLKAAYSAGYREVALKDAVITSDGKSAVFVNVFGSQSMSYKYHDTDCIGRKISVEVGMDKAEYSPQDFGDDVDADGSEISAFDLMQKYVETHPDFEGFCLAVDRSIKVAVPYCANSKSETLENGSDITLYRNGGNITSHVSTDEEFRAELLDGFGKGTKVSFFKSDKGVIFAIFKGKEAVTVKPETIAGSDYVKTENKAVEETYRLPFVLVLPNLGIHKEMQADEFDGKSKVKKQDIIDFLKSQYSIFKSPNRQAIVDYEKAHNIVSVMVAAGKKG